MKTTGISLVLILLAGTLVVPISFSQASELTVPNPPTNLAATAVSSTQINLSWAAPVNSTADQVNGYKIEIRPFCSGSFSVLVANTTNTTTTYSNSGLAGEICYEYKVSALNPVGTGNASNGAIATTLPNPPPATITPPSAPTGLNVTALSNTKLKLTWNVPSNTGGAPILGYKIQRNGTTIVNNTGNTKTSFTNSGLLAAHQETYRVAAWNSAGLGPYSNNATGTTKNQTSTLPTNISNLGQLVSDFVHQRNEILKQQRDDTLQVIKECHENLKNASPVNRTQIKDDCKAALKAIRETYKDTRKQLQQQFKDFRETAKSLIKEAKKLKEIDKEDVKAFKADLKSFDNQTKMDEKIFKKEVKSEEKKFKKELKELKKESKKSKKDKHHDEEDD
ncbi:MAG: fibronectin type III domain-containing protein [Nitrosopumilaceae archaeon]